MSLRYEQYRALDRTRNLLLDLLDPEKRPRSVKLLRGRVMGCLRHFPPLAVDGEPLFGKDDFDTPPLSHGTNDSERG